MLKIVLCDDEFNTVNYYQEQLQRLLNHMHVEHELTMFTDSGRLLSELYNNRRWDIYFLDIDMPLVNGLDLGQKIHDLDEHGYLNYISIHTEKVYESLKTRPFRFIPKDEFSKYIEPCIREIMEDMQQDTAKHHILLETKSVSYRFEIEEIMYIKSLDKYLQFYFKDGTCSDSIRYRMADLEKQLTKQGFIRIHKSYLVNYAFIQKILTTGILLDNGKALPVSRSRLDEIKSEYRRLIL